MSAAITGGGGSEVNGIMELSAHKAGPDLNAQCSAVECCAVPM